MRNFIKAHKWLVSITLFGIIAFIVFALSTNFVAAAALFIVLFANNVSLMYSPRQQ